MKSTFSKSRLASSIFFALLSPFASEAATLQPFNPIDNDQQVGSLVVNGGNSVDLTGDQQFQPGITGGANTDVGTLQSQNRIVNDNGVIGASRLDTGAQNFAIAIPDPITGGNTTFQVYNSNNFNELMAVDSTLVVPDITDVQDNNYINTRIADVSNGSTLNVNIGQPTADTGASTNSWLMIAKQSTLFNVDGNSLTPTTLNWNSNNYISFNGASGSPGAVLSYPINNLIVYNGAFSVQTLDGAVNNFNVTSAADLRSYNDWLISQLQSGNLATSSYLNEFNKASTRSNNTLDYRISVDDPNDDITQDIGERIVINTTGPNAVVNLAAGKTLEVSGASGGAVRGSSGAQIAINGKLSNEAYSGFEGAALYLTDGGIGTNNGVINGNFLNQFDGTGVAVIGSGSNGVQVLNNSAFTNNGILNFAAVGDNTSAINLGSGSTANNSGNINVGVNDLSGSGSNNGVLVGDAAASFINNGSGTIYIGRGPQNTLTDIAADTALNLSGGVNGILVNSAGSALNNGNIVIGTGVQNAAGILVTGVANSNVINNGVIDVNGAAAPIPLENIGISVINSGSGGTLLNTGTINLNGVNGTGLKVVATDGGTAAASSTGIININGNADPISGTRNFGVWVEGMGTGVASADVSGQFNLSGTGAIGIHARNNATVNVADDTLLNFNQGSDQIGFFAFGPNASVNIAGSHNFDVATTDSTLFRIESGANFSSNALSLTASGNGAKGIVGTGDNGTAITAQNTLLDVSGINAYGMVIEGGAVGSLDSASQINLTGTNSIGGLSDGQKHDLSGAASGVLVTGTLLTSAANLISTAANAVGYAAVNLGQIINDGTVSMTGASNTGLMGRTGGSVTNNGSLYVAQGTGIDADGIGTTIVRAGQVTVDDGIAGVRLANGALLALNGNDSDITANGTAHAILLDSGSGGLAINNATLNVLGSGNGIENAAETGNIVLQNAVINVNNGSGIRTATALDPLATLQVNVAGSGNGFSFTRADDSPASSDLNLSDSYLFNVDGAGGNGVYVNTSGNFTTGATVNVTNSAGGSALLVRNAGMVLNTGWLNSASLNSPVVDLSHLPSSQFENRGTINSSSATGPAILGSSGSDTILLSSGAVMGDVNTGAGDDFVTWSGGTLNGSLTLGGGENNRADITSVDLSQTRHITADPGASNQLNFSDINARGGSFAQDDLNRGVNLGNGWNVINFTNGTQWELTGDLNLANSNVNIDGTSVLLAGNGVNPIIAGGEPRSVIVTNAGIIDLTNGIGSPGNTLTIDGDLVSLGGTVKLQTVLNAGGTMANQFTDRLLVNGNASSGTTILDVMPTVASVGSLTDTNQNMAVEANEGISLVQVAGNSSAQSFALKGGYVAAGPWRYDLYSFAPGASDAGQRAVVGTGNNYWDYRLGNVYICENGCGPTNPPTNPPTTPPTTTPPVPPVTPSQPQNPVPPTDTSGTPAPQTPDGGTLPVAPAGSPVPAPIPANGRLQVTPQIPSYLSLPLGLAYYNAAIIDNLHRRLGELRHEKTLPDGNSPEMFLRYIGSNMTYKSNVSFNNYGYDFDMDYSAVQIGGNMLRLDGEKDSLRGGVAYTYGNSRIQPKAADGASSTTFDNNSLALYLTWQRQNGFYMDGVLAYGNHRGTTDIPRQKEVGSPKAKSWTASLESGYPFIFDNGWKLEPQAQLMFTRIDMDNFTDKDQTTVSYKDYNQTIGRLGVRADRTWVDDKGRQYSPYIRANYYQGWGGGAKVTAGATNTNLDYTFTGGKFGQMGELGVGGTVTLKNNLSLYAEVDYRKEINGNGAKGWGYTGGVRWTF